MCFSAALVLALALVLGSYGSPFNTLNELTCYMKASCFKFFFKCNWKVLGSDLPLNWLVRISFTDLKTRTTTLCSFGNSIKGKCLSVAFVSKDTLFKISSTDSRVRTTLFSILNTGAGKCCSVGVISMVTLWYVALRPMNVTAAIAQCCSCPARMEFSLAWLLAFTRSFASHVSRVVGDIRRGRLHKR